MRAYLADPKTLRPNPFNPNHVAPANMVKLRKSIQDLGFNSAVIVRELPDGTLQILGGQHRTEVAVELGYTEIPIINVGPIDDVRAKKIGIVDNSRYGTDDSIQLARLFDEIKLEDPDLTGFLPVNDQDLQVMMRAVSIDLDDLDAEPRPEGEDEPAPYEAERVERPAKTHDTMTFRVSVRDAEAIRVLLEKTIKMEGLDDGSDDKTLAGTAIAFLLLTKGSA